MRAEASGSGALHVMLPDANKGFSLRRLSIPSSNLYKVKKKMKMKKKKSANPKQSGTRQAR
jgi:hypothetical protein